MKNTTFSEVWKETPSSHLLILFGVSGALFLRLIWFVYQNSVNVIFWDQWDFLRLLFSNDHNLWHLFSLQHGPHRQGLGGLVTAVIYPLTGWNVRAEVFLSVALTAISCLLAFVVKAKLFGKLHWTDSVIPLIFFSLLQYETFVGTPNISHGPIPLLLITLTAYFLTISDEKVRDAGLVILVFFSTYTGFALFSAIPVMFLLFWFSLKSSSVKARLLNLGALLLSAGIFMSFFIDYQHAPAVECFRFPHEKPFEYVEFSCLQFARAWGMARLSNSYYIFHLELIVAAFIFMLLGLVWAYFSFRLIRNSDKKYQVIFYLSSFTILFTIFTAVGRVCLGLVAAFGSRYVMYAVPGMIAVYFGFLYFQDFSKVRIRFRYLLVSVLLLIMVLKEFTIEVDKHSIDWYRNGKQKWAQYYLENGNIDSCNKFANFKVHPYNDAIKEKLNYLEKENLNFFKARKKVQ